MEVYPRNYTNSRIKSILRTQNARTGKLSAYTMVRGKLMKTEATIIQSRAWN